MIGKKKTLKKFKPKNNTDENFDTQQIAMNEVRKNQRWFYELEAKDRILEILSGTEAALMYNTYYYCPRCGTQGESRIFAGIGCHQTGVREKDAKHEWILPIEDTLRCSLQGSQFYDELTAFEKFQLGGHWVLFGFNLINPLAYIPCVCNRCGKLVIFCQNKCSLICETCHQRIGYPAKPNVSGGCTPEAPHDYLVEITSPTKYIEADRIYWNSLKSKYKSK